MEISLWLQRRKHDRYSICWIYEGSNMSEDMKTCLFYHGNYIEKSNKNGFTIYVFKRFLSTTLLLIFCIWVIFVVRMDQCLKKLSQNHVGKFFKFQSMKKKECTVLFTLHLCMLSYDADVVAHNCETCKKKNKRRP